MSSASSEDQDKVSSKPNKKRRLSTLLDGLDLSQDEHRRIRRLLQPASAQGASVEEKAESLRLYLVAIHEQIMAAANKTKKPHERARHQHACKHAVLVFFQYLSGGAASDPCTYDECVAVADKGFRFSCPFLPAQCDVGADTYSRSWQGIEALKATGAFPSRLKAFLIERMDGRPDDGVVPHVSTTFEVVDADVLIDGLTTMCRFDMQVHVSNLKHRVFPVVRVPGMAKGCFSMNSKLLSLDIRFDLHGLLRDLESQTDTSLVEATIQTNRETETSSSSTSHSQEKFDSGVSAANNRSLSLNPSIVPPLHSGSGLAAATRSSCSLPQLRQDMADRGALPSVQSLLALSEQPLSSVITTGLYGNTPVRY